MSKSEQEKSEEVSLDDLPVDFGESSNVENDLEDLPVIPGYVIKRLLGRGGMGVVYEATWVKNDSKKVAIKTISVRRYESLAISTRRRFQRETELLDGLKHPAIVPILDRGEYEAGFQRIPYFTMPFLNLGDLSDTLDQAPILSREDLATWVERLFGVLEGLSVAHSLGVVHRDIKPRNLFLDNDETLLLGDFGLAKLLEEDSDLTSTLGYMGTALYASPEQLLSAKLADTRTDIYAIGVILHQFACFGVRPFASEKDSDDQSSEKDSIARWQRSTNRIAPMPSSRARHLSDPSFDFIVQKCLAYYPEHRYQSVDKLLSDLRAWRDGETVRGNLAERFRKTILTPIRTHWLPITIVSTFLFAIGIVVVAYNFSKISDDVSTLEQDVQKERHKQKSISQKRTKELQEELQSVLPNLRGEKRDFEISRLSNPTAEFKKLNDRAIVLADELGLQNSEICSDRHNYWVIKRTVISPYVDGIPQYAKHLDWLVDFANSNLKLAVSSGDQSAQIDAVSDLLRTHQMTLHFCWGLEERNWEKDYLDVIDTSIVVPSTRDALESLRQSDVVKTVPSTHRHLELMILEAALFDGEIDARKKIAICKSQKDEFSARRLEADGCEQLHPWYIAWYIFEKHFKLSRQLKQPASELRLIVDGWLELTKSTPAPLKTQNLTYLKDLIFVQECLGDVLRELGDFPEAKLVYEENWRRLESMRTYFPFDRKVWEGAELAISSLLVLAERERSTADLLLCNSRKQDLLREKLDFAKSNPQIFDNDAIQETKLDLAKSLFRHARVISQDKRQTFLDEAERIVKEVVESRPKSKEARALLSSIEETKSY